MIEGRERGEIEGGKEKKSEHGREKELVNDTKSRRRKANFNFVRFSISEKRKKERKWKDGERKEA